MASYAARPWSSDPFGPSGSSVRESGSGDGQGAEEGGRHRELPGGVAGRWHPRRGVGVRDVREQGGRAFRRDVDLAGQQWPDDWVKGAGYVAPEPEHEQTAPLLVAFAREYVRDLTGITPATRHRYDRQVMLLAEQLWQVLHEELTVVNLQEVHVRRWVNARETLGARPKTIANYHGLLFMVMASAVRVGLRPGNPCTGTRLPDRYSPDADGDGDAVFLTEAQFGLIAEAMFPAAALPAAPVARAARLPRAAAGRWAGTAEDRVLLEVAVGSGLRWSELTALQVHDLELDLPVPRLSVRRAWKRNPKGEFAVPGAGAYYSAASPSPRASTTSATPTPPG